MELKQLIQSKPYMALVLLLAVIAVIFLVFGIGMYVGYHKARFSYQWGENYHKNFGGPRGGLFRDFGGKDFINSHGAAGQIIKIDSATNAEQTATLIIKGQDNVEKIVLVKSDTLIERLRETIKSNDLKVDDIITVIGLPNDQGQIEAKFIRILPSMSTSTKPFILPARGAK